MRETSGREGGHEAEIKEDKAHVVILKRHRIRTIFELGTNMGPELCCVVLESKLCRKNTQEQMATYYCRPR